MQQTKSPYLRGLIHLFLVGWAIYSVTPFMMSIITSLHLTRDATGRRPKFLAQVISDNNVLIGIVTFVLALGVYWLYLKIRIEDIKPVTGEQKWKQYGIVALVTGIIAIGFVLLTNSVPDQHIFAVTAKNYQSLWLSVEPEEFAPYAIGLIVLAIVLLVAAFNVRRIPVGKTYVFFTIIAVIVATIVVLPSLVKFA